MTAEGRGDEERRDRAEGIDGVESGRTGRVEPATDSSLSDQPSLAGEPPLKRVGHYLVEAEIGRGGMGIVYRARDPRLNRIVAIKALPVLLLGNPRRRARFEREAKLLALVNHPGIAAIHAMYEEAERPFLILEYVPGESLADRLLRGALPLAEALAVCRSIAEALEAAHERGVVHRDLKPANVRITPGGEVKVLDFGLAKLLADDDDRSRPERAGEGGGAVRTDVTFSGAQLGSAGYMSPEQARGDRSDRRSDVWAFGCVLFECLTGAKLWGEGTAAERLRAIVETRLPLDRLAPETPVRLQRLLERCLEKEPSRRFQGFAEVCRELESCLAELVGREPVRSRLRAAGLPASVTRFVGRVAERRAVAALVHEARLVTLTGLGGVGKTRLALSVAEDLAERFAAGVWFVDLGSLGQGERVAAAVAKVMGVIEASGVTLEDALRSELAQEDQLLVLDNCEGVAESVASLAANLLRGCAGLRVLATSRRPLDLGEEACFPVPPLVESEALELFVSRAAVATPGFALSGENRDAVAEVVHRVAGIPLAIELAAARLRALSVEQLALRLDDRLSALGSSAGPRHETVRDLVAWSYEGLGESERRLQSRLGVFAGSFTLEAAEMVCSSEDLREQDVLDALLQLVDWALVSVEKAGLEIRYRLLMAVRELARERLREAQNETSVSQRHLDFYLGLAERAARQLQGPDQAAWLERLELEFDDLNAALRFASTESGAAHRGLRLATALEQFWRGRYRQDEGRGHIERLLAAGAAAEDPGLQERALNVAGWLAYLRSDLRASWRLHEEALDLANATGSREGRSRALDGLALVAWQDGALAAARTRWLERLELCRELGDRHGLSATLNNLGNVESRAGDLSAARAYREQSLAVARELGDASKVAMTLANLALLDVRKGGDHRRARSLLEESLALREELKDRLGILIARSNLAVIAAEADPALGRRLCEEVLQSARELDARGVVVIALNHLCALAREIGDAPAARVSGLEGLRLARRIGDRVLAVDLLENLLRLDLEEGLLQRVARLLGAADAARAGRAILREPDAQGDYDADVARLRTGLGDAAYTAARSSGMALDLDRAIDEALAAPTPPAEPAASGVLDRAPPHHRGETRA